MRREFENNEARAKRIRERSAKEEWMLGDPDESEPEEQGGESDGGDDDQGEDCKSSGPYR